MANRVLKIIPDSDSECPMDWDCQWKLYSFDKNSIHNNVNDLSIIEEDENSEVDKYGDHKLKFTEDFQKKLDSGLAFFLSHRHNEYFVDSDLNPEDIGNQRDGGILIWEHPEDEIGAKASEARRKDAEGFLDTYNKWANGEVYGFVLEDQYENHLDSCWGFYDFPSMLEYFYHLSNGDNLRIEDKSYDFFSVDKLKKKYDVVVVDWFESKDPTEDDILLKRALTELELYFSGQENWESLISDLKSRLERVNFKIA